MQKTIYYATTNAGKFQEVKRYLEEHEPSIELKQLDQEIDEIQTMDQKAVALDKAEKAWSLIEEPVIVDDSAIYFDHYNNFPGTLTKFVYHGIGFEGLLKLAEDDNRATRKIFMVYKDKEKESHVFEGMTQGRIIRPKDFSSHPRLPYDAIFQPEGANKTMAFIKGTKEEAKYSYRLKALEKFLDFLKFIEPPALQP